MKSIFLCGIGGIAMCGVAGILKNLGFDVAGSEKGEVYPPASEILKKIGITPFKFAAENILTSSPDAVIVGNAVSKENPEVLAAKSRGIPLFSFPQFFERYILDNKKVVVCAGTHGKTTTTSMTSFLLESLGFEPSYLIGGVLQKKETNFATGSGEWFVIEGDEYPSSSFDPVPKFLHYNPFALILTSLELDHVDVYKDISELLRVFSELLRLIPENGVVVYNEDSPLLRDLIKNTRPKGRITSYGKDSKSDFKLINWSSSFKKGVFYTKVSVQTPDKGTSKFLIPLVGEHNALNFTGIYALLKVLGVKDADLAEVISFFPGVKRRQEVVYADENVLVVDDFAHHPTAVKKTLLSLKKACLPDKVILFFEPRTNSSKRKVFEEEYIKSLCIADEVYLKTPPGLEKLPEEQRIDLAKITNQIKKLGKNAAIFEERIKLELKPNEKTLVVCMSSAYMSDVMEKIKEVL